MCVYTGDSFSLNSELVFFCLYQKNTKNVNKLIFKSLLIAMFVWWFLTRDSTPEYSFMHYYFIYVRIKMALALSMSKHKIK